MSLTVTERQELEAMTATEVVECLAENTHGILRPEVANAFAKTVGIDKIPEVDDELGVSVIGLVHWMCDEFGITTSFFCTGRGRVVKELCSRLNSHLAK